MSTVAENWKLIFFAEGDDAGEYLDLLDEEDEDEVYEHEDGYVLVHNRELERVWLYELTDLDETF